MTNLCLNLCNEACSELEAWALVLGQYYEVEDEDVEYASESQIENDTDED